MNRKYVAFAALVLLLVTGLFGCGRNETLHVADDEIALQIQLDVDEDIGLLIVDYEANGSGGSGGTSNADKSMLKRDEMIVYTLSRDAFDSISDGDNISIRFKIITEYVDPNFENIYPDEYTKPLNTINVEARFGEAYNVAISGNVADGYTAVLVG